MNTEKAGIIEEYLRDVTDWQFSKKVQPLAVLQNNLALKYQYGIQDEFSNVIQDQKN